MLLREPLPGMEPPPPRDDPLPAGWRWVRLGDVCVQDRHVVTAVDGQPPAMPYLGLEHVESQSGRILFAPDDLPTDAGTSTSFAFDARHVLYGKLRPYLNKVALPTFAGRCTTELIPLLPTGVDRRFLSLLLRRPETVEAAMRGHTGSRMPRADMDDLLAWPVPLPPSSEQRRVVACLAGRLSAVDRARAAAEAELAAAEALPAAYLQALFDSAEAQRWPERRLADICEIQLGKMLSPTSKHGRRPRPYLRNANVQWGRFDLTDVAEMDFTEAEEAKFLLREGDLLVCEGGEPGRAAVWRGEIVPCLYQKALHRLRPLGDAVDPTFLMYRLWRGSRRGEFLESDKQTTILHLPAVRLAALSVGLPPIAEQQDAAARLRTELAAADRLCAKLQQQLAAIDELPAALLRLAFSGKL